MDVDAPKPDPNIGKAAEANSEIAGRMQDLAERQYTDQKALLDQYSPLLKDLIGKSVTAQDKATQQSDSAWADYTATWRPVEQKLAADSLAYASPERQAQEAQRAASGVAQTFDQARADTRQALQSAGADATTIASLEAAGRLEEAKAKAGASDNARRDVEKAGLAYVDNAARFGRNMTSTGIATAQLAGQSGGQAQGGYGALSAATATPANSAGGLYSGAVGANSAAGNLYLGQYRAQADAAAQQNGIFGDVLGAGAGLLGMSTNAAGASGLGMFGISSEKAKKVGKKVDGRKASDAVERTPSKEWSYKPGLGDGNTKPRMGPMAEGLRDATGGVVSDGKMVDFIAMSGMHHAAIGDNSKRLRRIEKQLGLADAEA